MKKSIIQSLIGITLIFAVAYEARADVKIVPPNQSVAGHTQLFWAEAWWQWIFSNPDATNPNNDLTGAFAGNGNTGPVFFSPVISEARLLGQLPCLPGNLSFFRSLLPFMVL
jgi:hypothetical protein